MANYLNEFIETIQGVPDEVQRNFCLIRDLDKSYTDYYKDLLKLHADYMAELKKCVTIRWSIFLSLHHSLCRFRRVNSMSFFANPIGEANPAPIMTPTTC